MITNTVRHGLAWMEIGITRLAEITVELYSDSAIGLKLEECTPNQCYT
jgi:hypothetical protein